MATASVVWRKLPGEQVGAWRKKGSGGLRGEGGTFELGCSRGARISPGGVEKGLSRVGVRDVPSVAMEWWVRQCLGWAAEHKRPQKALASHGISLWAMRSHWKYELHAGVEGDARCVL